MKVYTGKVLGKMQFTMTRVMLLEGLIMSNHMFVSWHTSEQVGSGQNRPDQDTPGNFWNLLSGGAEVGNLTTRGDFVYYGGSGPNKITRRCSWTSFKS